MLYDDCSVQSNRKNSDSSRKNAKSRNFGLAEKQP